MPTTHHGYLVIADITGYTRYLTESELDHAQQILTTLLELLVGHTRPPLVLSRLAGDAVISYGLEDQFFQGQTFVELIETTYVAFRQAIDRMRLNNTCRCNACANVGELDLKFFVHHGAFGLQRIDQHDELVGADVIMIHRLLKNHVVEQTGIAAYALYTEAATRRLGLDEICAAMTPHAEAYEHLGEVKLWVQDLRPAWRRSQAAPGLTIPPEQVAVRAETNIALPPEVVWEYLTRPEYRSIAMGSDRQVITGRQRGRVGAGTVYQCYHGNEVIAQTILEWRPFEHMLSQDLLPLPIKGTSVLVEFRLAPTSAGTHLTLTFSKGKGPWLGQLMVNRELPRRVKPTQRNVEAFKQRLETEHPPPAAASPA
jgi:uncharacterized protein YndB with AHSA1/START domain